MSKIFPGGFGWQYFSSLAAAHGLEASDLGFAILTGAGDMVGVTLGHSIYYAMKKMIDPTVDLKKECGTGVFLGSAAFCSGSVWQPTVNALQSIDIPFAAVAMGTWMTCGLAFFGGLKLFRAVYSPLGMVAANSSKNFATDAQLSVSIGGATGAFVCTDVAYLNGNGNFLLPLVGVQPTDSIFVGCVKAGMATSFGLIGSQAVQNVTYSTERKIWTD